MPAAWAAPSAAATSSAIETASAVLSRGTARETGRERGARDVVEDQRPVVVGQLEVADPDDVRLVEIPQGAELAQEPLPAELVREDERVEALDRDDVAGALVGRSPDLGRTARAERLVEPVSTEQDSLRHGPSLDPNASNGGMGRSVRGLHPSDGSGQVGWPGPF